MNDRVLIAQKDCMGCGVACVANRFGISYDEALMLFEYPYQAKTIGFACKYIVQAVKSGGHTNARLRYIGKFTVSEIQCIPEGAIVLLRKSELYPYQHYLIRDHDEWIDPWINMHEDANVKNARAGIRHSLPGDAYYAII